MDCSRRRVLACIACASDRLNAERLMNSIQNWQTSSEFLRDQRGRQHVSTLQCEMLLFARERNHSESGVGRQNSQLNKL